MPAAKLWSSLCRLHQVAPDVKRNLKRRGIDLAANADGAVYLHQLDSYITDRVKVLSQGKQHPVTAKPTSIRSFPLAKP